MRHALHMQGALHGVSLEVNVFCSIKSAISTASSSLLDFVSVSTNLRPDSENNACHPRTLINILPDNNLSQRDSV